MAQNGATSPLHSSRVLGEYSLAPSGSLGPEALARSSASGERRVLGRATYAAFRLGSTQVAIVAEGTLPHLNDRADLAQSPLRIFPPRFELFFVQQAISLPATRPFRIVEIFGYPNQQATLVVRDADGPHKVEIKDSGVQTLVTPGSENTSVAYSTTSIQDAFDSAVAQLPPPNPGNVADQLIIYTLKRAGKVESGFGGFHHYFAEVEVQ